VKTINSAKKILIIEDEAPLRSVLRDNLEIEGFNVHEASDGEEGLKMAMTHKPDLILLDILMPRMDGLTMMDVLRGHAWGKNIPVILLTNLSANERIMKGVVENVPVYFFEKTGRTIGEIIAKIKSRLELPQPTLS
jgi:DNA-binding response OmpR family regulator